MSQPRPSIQKHCHRRSFVLVVLWLIPIGFLATAVPAAAQTTRVLLVGDSWSFFLWNNQSLRNTFAAHGYPQIVEEGSNTTINGSTAQSWTAQGRLDLITDELNANPEIDVVQVTLGGNDFLAGAPNGWYATISEGDEQALFAEVLGNLETVVDHILQHNPDLEVLVSLYDYVNFEDYGFPFDIAYCDDTVSDMENPETIAVNSASVEFSTFLEQIAATRPRVEVRSHSGLMQYLFGIPEAVPPILPGELPPPGDPAFPSPIAAMQLGADCIHLSPDGYMGVTESLWWTYYEYQFGGLLFEDGFESGDLGAWE